MVLLGLWMATAAVAQEPKWTPGREVAAAIPGGIGTMQVCLPVNYSAARSWPAIFCYHGTSGQPTTGFITPFSQRQDFIVVGLPFVEQGIVGPLTPEQQKEYLARERANLAAAWKWVAANTTMDSTRVYLGGVSKGGWITSVIGGLESPRFAGLIILLAGCQKPAQGAPGPNAFAGKSVYIGVGETDGNLLSAYQARSVFQHYGARVTLEEFKGIGHAMPARAERFTAWLRVQGHYRHAWTPEEERKAVRDELEAKYRDVMKEPNAENRYRRLRDLCEDPLLSLCGDAVIKAMGAQLAAAAVADAVRADWTAEREFGEHVWREWNMRTLSDLKGAYDGLMRTSATYPATVFGKRSAAYAEFILPMVKQAEEQLRKAQANMPPPGNSGGVKVEGPTDGPTIPGRPTIKIRR